MVLLAHDLPVCSPAGAGDPWPIFPQSIWLSPILVTSILTVLLRLRDRGLSILLVEQNATLTFEATQRCLVMENGRAVLTAAAAELRHNSDVRRIYLGI
jgi:branched-chain amino acid transport system ATP-binding protein